MWAEKKKSRRGGHTSWKPLSGRTAVWKRHYHIISIFFFFFFHRGYDLSNHTAISEGERGNLNQLKDRRTYGWLIRPAFTCWLRSTSWIKMPRCQQQQQEEEGEGRHPELLNATVKTCIFRARSEPLLMIQGHTVRRRQLRRFTGFTESEFQEVFLHNRLVIARLRKRTRQCGSPDFNPVCWEWLSYPDPFDWLSAGRLPRWPTK